MYDVCMVFICKNCVQVILFICTIVFFYFILKIIFSKIITLFPGYTKIFNLWMNILDLFFWWEESNLFVEVFKANLHLNIYMMSTLFLIWYILFSYIYKIEIKISAFINLSNIKILARINLELLFFS